MQSTKNLKQLFLILASFCFVLNCSAWQHRQKNQENIPYKKKYPNKYKDQLEPDSKLLAALYHITVEKTKEGTYIKKQYYPSTKQMISYETFSDKKLTNQNGLTKGWTEEGYLVSEGYYKDNKSTGEWKNFKSKNGEVYLSSKGNYTNGKKDGPWESYNEFSELIRTSNYKMGRMNRPNQNLSPTQRDSLKLVNEKRRAEKSSEDNENKIYKVAEQMPTFLGCGKIENKRERKTCSDSEMLKFIYGNLKYPPIGRKEGIQGRVIVNFTVTKTGEIKDIKVLRPICEEFKLETIRLVESMPNWNPGKHRGEVVNVKFTLPISFKL